MTDSFTVKLVSEDYLNASRLHLRNILLTRKMVTFTIILWLIYIGIALFTLSEWTPARIIGAAVISTIITVALLLIVAVITYALLPWRTRKLFTQNQLLQYETQVEITDTGITSTSEKAQARLDYPMVYKWAANDRMLALYAAENLFYIFPRRFMNEAQFQKIIGGLQAANCKRIGPKIS